MRKPKLLIIGHARHGKDTMAEIIAANYDFTFRSSSEAAAEIFLYAALKEKHGYTSFMECFEDRVNHRAEWYDLITEYNSPKYKLASEILKTSDCYVGMRNADEIQACRDAGLFDLVVWVDASKRLPLEDKSSFNIDVSCADIIIDNNGTLEEFTEKVNRFAELNFTTTNQIDMKPINDRVIVRPEPVQEKSAGGIIIPDSAKEKPQSGEVIAVGVNPEVGYMQVNEGDVVMYGKYSGTEITINGEDLVVLREDDILVKL